MPTTLPLTTPKPLTYPYQGTTLLITGAGSGIGKAVAERFYAQGASVILNGRNEEKLTKLSQHLQSTYEQAPGQVSELPADISDSKAACTLVQEAVKRLGHIDVLVNNAGVSGKVALVQEVSEAEIHHTLGINLKGALFMMQHTLQYAMVPASSGLIININSIVGKTPFPFWSIYDASKAGLKAASDAIADEQRSNGIRVASIYPGAVDTPLWEQIEPQHRLNPKGMVPAESIADAVEFMVNQPAHVLVNDMTLTPLNPIV